MKGFIMYPENQPSFPPQQTPPNPYAQAPQVPSRANDPGKTMAIIGLVLAFFFSILGLVLSIIARNKSKGAGYTNNIALIGIILNTASIVLGLIVSAFLIIAMISLANDSNQSIGNTVEVDSSSELGQAITNVDLTEQTYNAKANAEQIVVRANNYKQNKGDYPKSIDNFKEYSDSMIPSSAQKHVSTSIPTQSSGSRAYYQYCGTNSAQVLYYNYSDSKVSSLGLGAMRDDDQSCA